MKKSRFNIYFELEEKNYIFNTKSNALIEYENDIFSNTQYINDLLSLGILIEDDIDEVAILVDEINENIMKKSTVLNVTILLTNQCNFRCIYCYQDKHSSYLSIKSADEFARVIEDIFMENEYTEFNIHYFGGEPLLNLNTLEYLDEKLKRLCEKYNITFLRHITTNGSLLTKEVITKFNFNEIQLTFDGSKENHELFRVNSFFSYENQLNLINDILTLSNSTILCRMNVCEENKENIDGYITNLFNRFKTKRIIIYIHRMEKYTENNLYTVLDNEQYARVEFLSKSLLSELNHEYKIPKSLYYNCSTANGNTIVVNTDLSLRFCTVVSNDSFKHFDKECIQNKSSLKLADECMNCKVLPLCLGGCPVQRDLGSGACITEKYHIEDLLKKYCINNLTFE